MRLCLAQQDTIQEFIISDPETMTKTVETALAPLLITGSFCNLGLFEYPLGQPRPYLTCLYFLTTWSLFAYFFYYLVYISSTLFLYTSWPSMIIMISAIVSMLVSLFRYKELKMCLHKLSIVDDTLELLGSSKKYQRLRKWIILMISGWIALSLFMNIVDSIWLNYDHFSISRICVPFLGNYLLHVNTLSALTWGTILGYTSSRFQQVNKHIHLLYSDLLEDNANCIKRNRFIIVNQRKTEAKECKRYMWIIMHVHLQICLISRELNKVFNVQMTVQMTSYFAFILELCLEIYSTYISKTSKSSGHILDNIFAYVWGIMYSVIILILNHICQTVYYKANKTIANLYKLSNDNLDEDLREQTLQFILQIKQTEIKFGSGFSYFGYNFIRGFYKSIVTVLVIVIQMGYID
ncbi:uncharacterized protein [Temnothorax longispinosus]|uniref:uncharacterized protein n=1 Tax=Temnothorax longispinosus TaxID=300112 RepID=UPI003A99ACD9